MYPDHVDRIEDGVLPPRHPSHTVQDELTGATGLPACGLLAPRSSRPGVLPFRCSRDLAHDGTHVAAQDTSGRYIAEWDNDRTTDTPTLEGPPA